MNQNKINYLRSIRTLGPSRPQDILVMMPESLKIVANPTDPKSGAATGYILFTNTYFRCGNEHIFVNHDFSSKDNMALYIEEIPNNSRIHIFSREHQAYPDQMLDFCKTLLSEKDCIKVILHVSPTDTNCIWKYYQKRTSISRDVRSKGTIIHERKMASLILENERAFTDFWCTDVYSFQKREAVVQDELLEISLSSKDYSFPTGIRVYLNPSLISSPYRISDEIQDTFLVRAIKSRFNPCIDSKNDDLFNIYVRKIPKETGIIG